ncbi:MAG: lysophospholipid acyltransferase family protein [Ilumatobacter sp.]|uniref:lysophospholipid acyltransferase family protein n=1 Tax=Ilumatobacter sp. TaxID=1967498 RepID=UPI0026037BAB|nr:lysophospholipid acyltransferase family protein [Ilumatobacter sp.]MDJ0769922.1 lysophospholipid acyltransferase family protein [Ilumatobacter sp.]
MSEPTAASESGADPAKPTFSSSTMDEKPETFLAGNGLGSRVFYRVAWLLVVPILRLYTRLTVNGREHLPRDGAFVLAPVHRSYLDTPFAGCVRWKRMRFMGKDTMWKNRQFGWIFSALGSFPVTRGTADREALRRSIEVLQGGDPLVLFPEGERKEGPVVQPLFDGAVYIAIKAGVPIVPVGIGGSERVMPKGSKFVYPRKVHVEIGPPIPPPVAPDGGRLPRTAYREHADALHAELQRLFDLAMTRVPWRYPIES